MVERTYKAPWWKRLLLALVPTEEGSVIAVDDDVVIFIRYEHWRGAGWVVRGSMYPRA